MATSSKSPRTKASPRGRTTPRGEEASALEKQVISAQRDLRTHCIDMSNFVRKQQAELQKLDATKRLHEREAMLESRCAACTELPYCQSMTLLHLPLRYAESCTTGALPAQLSRVRTEINAMVQQLETEARTSADLKRRCERARVELLELRKRSGGRAPQQFALATKKRLDQQYVQLQRFSTEASAVERTAAELQAEITTATHEKQAIANR